MSSDLYQNCRCLYRLSGQRSLPCRLGAQGNEYCRDGDARTDGDPRGVCGIQAPQGGAYCRLASYDHPDRRADRNPRCLGGGGPLGFMQHFLHPGSCRSSHRRSGCAGFCIQGGVSGRILGLYPPHFRMGRRRHRQHDSRRRRRCHPSGASGERGREGSLGHRQSDLRRGAVSFCRHRQAPCRRAWLVLEGRAATSAV